MIPYEDITFTDWKFYWAQSALFTKRDGKWIACRPIVTDEMGSSLHSGDVTLEQLANSGIPLDFINILTGERFSAGALQPFQSKDWITYEPDLGYFLLGDRLWLLDCSAPRSRYKGLCMSRLHSSPPVDLLSLPKVVRRWVSIEGVHSISFNDLLMAVSDRLNSGFPELWGDCIMEGIEANMPVILEPTVAMIPDPHRKRGALMYNGVMLGMIEIADGGLVYAPRTERKSTLETAVSNWVQSKLKFN